MYPLLEDAVCEAAAAAVVDCPGSVPTAGVVACDVVIIVDTMLGLHVDAQVPVTVTVSMLLTVEEEIVDVVGDAIVEVAAPAAGR